MNTLTVSKQKITFQVLSLQRLAGLEERKPSGEEMLVVQVIQNSFALNH
jgi:hypothetical protein